MRHSFFRRQYELMVFVTSSSQLRSAIKVNSSIAPNYFTALGLGLPSGRSLPELARIATSSGEQLSSLATCVAWSRAGRSLSSCVSSVSPVVAAAGVAVAASQRLAALALRCTRCLDHNQRQQTEPARRSTSSRFAPSIRLNQVERPRASGAPG